MPAPFDNPFVGVILMWAGIAMIAAAFLFFTEDD